QAIEQSPGIDIGVAKRRQLLGSLGNWQLAARVLRKYYIRPSIGGRQMFCLAEWGDQAGGEAYWRHATPPLLMTLHDPPPPVRCRRAGRHCGDVSITSWRRTCSCASNWHSSK